MSEVDDYFANSQLAARQANIASLDTDPDQAAEAMSLSDATGVPSTAIYGDIDGFKRAHKAALGSAIISDNEYVADYLNSHPMAPRVSHDDLGALDEHSRSLTDLQQESSFQKWLKDDSIARWVEKSFGEGFGDQPVGRTAFQRPSDIEFAISHPLVASVASLPSFAGELVGRTAAGLLHMGYDGMSAVFGEKFAREMAAMAEYSMMRGDVAVRAEMGPSKIELRNRSMQEAMGREIDIPQPPPIPDIAAARTVTTMEIGGHKFPFNDDTIRQLGGAQRAIELMDLYGEAKKEPPPNVHPLIDEAKKLEAKEDLKKFDEGLKTATQTATRDRAPDMLAQFDKSHVGDREISIDADAVKALYGDKLPEAEDNMLGWIPDLEKQLGLASLTGGEIRVPLRDWYAKVDPEIAKQLHDDIRVRDNGFTLNETKIDAPSKEVIAEPVTALRGSAGLEPMFQVGDRKLTLNKRPHDEKIDAPTGITVGGKRFDADHFNIFDENNKRLGYMDAVPLEEAKKVWISNIGGFEHLGFGPNSFGPTLTRSLIQQIKAAYPKVEEIGGFRISGAREKAGTTGVVWMKVQAEDYLDSLTHDQFKSLLTQNWEDMGQGLSALFHEEGKGLAADSLLGQMVLSELRRIAPDVEADVAHMLVSPQGAPRGVYIPNLRSIIVSLTSPDPIGTARHEAIHGLRRLGVISEKEWGTLEKAVQSEKWIEKFDIAARWAEYKDVNLPEEAIAEAYRDWASGGKMPPETHTIFEKIKAFFEGLRQRIGELFGHDFKTWEQIFEKIDSGEIGAREPKFEEPTGEIAAMPEGEEPFGLYNKAKALGVTQTHMDRMLKLIKKSQQEDLEASQRRAETRQRRKSNKEWKERRTQLRDEVNETLSQRPDLATDAFMTKSGVKLHPDFLSEEQKSRLPKDYIQKKNGVNPDVLATEFGYTSGDALVERLALLTEDRTRSGMSQRDYFNRLVDIETDRRLNREFGDREQTILDEARDQASSETQLNLVHEETLAYALKAGVEPPFTKEEVHAMVKQAFDQTPAGKISYDRIMQKAGMIGKKIEEAGAKGDWAEAYRLSQQRQHAIVAAKLAKDYERARKQFDRTAKTLGKNRTFAGIEQEYVNWLHDLLLRTGYSVRRSVQDLAENIARQSETNLSDFIDAKEKFFMGMRQLDVPDFLRDPDFRTNVDDLSVHEFEGLRQGMKILEKAGRDEKSITVGGERWDLAKTKSEFRKQLESFGFSLLKAMPENSKFRLLRSMAYGLTNMETLLNRWDRGSPMGVFNRTIIYPLVEAANGKSRLLREIAKDLQQIDRVKAKDLQKLIDAPFPDPMTPGGEGAWTGFNRGNVLMMLQNAGNKSNWNVLARGYGADPEALFKWLQKNVTREDVERAMGVGGIFKKLIAQSDKVYERLTGATVEKIPLEPITFNFADGTSITTPGWYHPLDRDPVRASMWKEDPETGERERVGARSRESAFDDSNYFHTSTSNGYTKKRTGAIYPLNLDYNMVPSRMRQMAHDIHFREPILNVEKIFGDRLFQEDVAKYYGREYAKGLMPYLRSLAGSEGIRSENAMWGESFLEKARQNIISTYIGFNPFTIFKHGPTAAWFSSREVGTGAFASAVLELAKPGGKAIRQFIKENSEEIQRRERHWQDTLGGQQNELSAKATIREQIIDWGSKGVAWSDMKSAEPTWWAAYQKYSKDESHGMAVTLADRAVRRAHGSTAETNLPALVRGGGVANRYMTSVYGFFGTAMQRRIEMAHQVNDIYKLGKEGELNAAAKNMPKLLGDFMTYVVWPTLVEEAVTSMTTEDRRGWGAHMLSGATMGISSSILYVRDLMYGLTTGHDPGAGLISSAMHDMANVARDIRRGKDALNKQHAGKTIEDTLTLFGEVTGKMPKTIARGARFLTDVTTGQQKPKSPVEWMRGMSHGTAERRKH